MLRLHVISHLAYTLLISALLTCVRALVGTLLGQPACACPNSIRPTYTPCMHLPQWAHLAFFWHPYCILPTWATSKGVALHACHHLIGHLCILITLLPSSLLHPHCTLLIVSCALVVCIIIFVIVISKGSNIALSPYSDKWLRPIACMPLSTFAYSLVPNKHVDMNHFGPNL